MACQENELKSINTYSPTSYKIRIIKKKSVESVSTLYKLNEPERVPLPVCFLIYKFHASVGDCEQQRKTFHVQPKPDRE